MVVNYILLKEVAQLSKESINLQLKFNLYIPWQHLIK